MSIFYSISHLDQLGCENRCLQIRRLVCGCEFQKCAIFAHIVAHVHGTCAQHVSELDCV